MKPILLPFILLFALGCDLITEEIEIERLIRDTIKIPEIDTVYIPGDSVPVFIDRIRIDSIAYPVFVNDTIFVPTIVRTVQVDTVYLPGETITDIDTVFIERIVETTVYDTIINTVYVRDTIHVVQHHYADTMYIPLGWSTTSIGEYEGAVSEFYTKAAEYGWEPWGGDILIQPWTHDEAPPASRSSYSFFYFDQFILKIKDTLTPDEAFTPIFRELARWQLGKKYTNEPDDIMNPDFDWKRLKLSDSDAKKRPYLDRLFSKEPI